jgi:hypothetical protein
MKATVRKDQGVSINDRREKKILSEEKALEFAKLKIEQEKNK